MQSWCRIWSPNGSSHTRAKQKLLRKHKGACKSSWSRIGSLKSFTLTNPCGIWQSLWRSFLESLYVNTTQIGNKWDCWKSSTQSKRRYFCRNVAIRSGWKSGVQIPWNAILICEMFKISCLMGRLYMSDVLGNHLKDQSFHLVHWLSITLSLRKTSQESINLERKSYLDCSLDTLCTRGEFGMVTHWLQTLRSWKRWTHQKSTLKGSMQRRWYFPKKMKILFFPAADGRIKLPGRDQELRKSTLIRERPIRGESHVDFFGESEGSLSPPHDSFPDAGEAMNDFWSMSGNFIYRHHAEPRVKLYSPREESFPIPLKYIDVSRTTHTNLDVMQERRIDDYWNVDGSRDLSGSWTGFTQFYSIRRDNLQTDICGPGVRLTRRQVTHPGQIIYDQSSG